MNDRIAPDNTSAYPTEAKLLVGLALHGIEDMEKRGQTQLVASAVLPTDTGGTDAEFEALGFTFGAQVPGDPLFRDATIPAGWSKDATDHSMGSVIKDERGIARVSIFYKAAYYDRKADMHIMNVGYRFTTEWIYGDDTPEFNPLLTDDELLSILKSAVSSLQEIEDCPQVYEKNRPRVESLLAAVKSKLSARGSEWGGGR